MALTKSSQSLQASAANNANSTTNGAGFTIGYGVSGTAMITNGGTGPTVACTFNLQGSADNSNWFTISSQTAGVAANGIYLFPFSLGVGGANGDWTYYRSQFTGNTVQNVTVQADASTTTAL